MTSNTTGMLLGMVDRALDVICLREQRVVVSPKLWVEAFGYAIRHETVLTTGLKYERTEHVNEFVAAMPPVDVWCDENVDVDDVAYLWTSLIGHIYRNKNRLVDYPNLVDKLVELTEGVDNVPVRRVGQRTNLWFSVREFYQNTVLWEEFAVAFTAFKLKDFLSVDILTSVAAMPEFSAALIEEHAFSSRRELVEVFAAHPNCPARLRALMTVSLPQMERST